MDVLFRSSKIWSPKKKGVVVMSGILGDNQVVDDFLRRFQPENPKGLLLGIHEAQTEQNKAYLREVSAIVSNIDEAIKELKSLRKPLLREREILEKRVDELSNM